MAAQQATMSKTWASSRRISDEKSSGELREDQVSRGCWRLQQLQQQRVISWLMVVWRTAMGAMGAGGCD